MTLIWHNKYLTTDNLIYGGFIPFPIMHALSVY